CPVESLIIQEVETPDMDVLEYMQPFTEGSLPDGTLSKALIDGYLSGKFDFGTDTNLDGNLLLSGDNVLFTNPHSFDYDGNIEKIKFYCSALSSFSLKFGIGIIDQRPW